MRIYLDLSPSAQLSRKLLDSARSLTFCGRSLQLWQRSQYSLDSLLLLEFHSEPRSSDDPTSSGSTERSNGFMGAFRFLNRSFFESDGDHLPATICDQQFLSMDSNSSATTSSGTFFSPRYPSTYSENMNCAYYFMGKYNEQVLLEIEELIFGNSDTR